jgi:DNA repair photolyase
VDVLAEFPDEQAGRTVPPARGRGAGLNPANRFERLGLEILPEARAEAKREHPGGVQVPTVVYRDDTRSLINRVDSPDLGFNWTINPYRGCEHGCIYCYARPSHETLGFSCGLDFETRIVAKPDAPRLLERELARKSWAAEPIVMSGVTDCYQPIEERLRITRACLEVLAQCRQPVCVVTKNRMVVRDLDLLAELARHGAGRVALSVTTLDRDLAAKLEPRASCPADRLRAIREVSSGGVPVSVLVAPVIPGVNDAEIPGILRAAAEAGATSAGWVLLRLPHQVKDLFLDWLCRQMPQRAAHVESLLRQMSGGRLYDQRFGIRQRGRGPLAAQVRRTFEVFSRRYGLSRPLPAPSAAAFRRPASASFVEPGLFDPQSSWRA